MPNSNLRFLASLLTFFLVVCPSSTFAVALEPPGANGAHATSRTEAFTIVIENVKDGRIFIAKKENVFVVGKVIYPVTSVNRNGFTASKWGQDGSVCATAVNAIHIKVANNPETGRGIIFSILPKEFYNFDPSHYQSYYSRSASLFTDIPAGTAIFGGGYAPTVGSKVKIAKVLPEELRQLINFGVLTKELKKEEGLTELALPYPMPKDYVPREGEAFIIEVDYPEFPDYIEFENRFGGLVKIKYIGQAPQVIGQVLKPVAGVGRFEGTAYAKVGRIRANHPGVIDISTSPLGEIGGFQIVPREHAMSPELVNVRVLTQWMVVGPLDPRDASWEGKPPLFSRYIFPSFIPLVGHYSPVTEIDALNRLLSRFYVLAKMRGTSSWGPLPAITGRNDTALVDLEAIRIYFPLPSVDGG